jgi:TPR repeat protein
MIRQFVAALAAAGLFAIAGGGCGLPAHAQASASTQEIAGEDKALAHKQFAAALDHYDIACDAGNGDGCFKAERIYEPGQGVKPSASMAVRRSEAIQRRRIR